MVNKRYSSEISPRLMIAVELYLLDLTTWLPESPCRCLSRSFTLGLRVIQGMPTLRLPLVH
jgi:hypothetical protein